MGYSLSNRVNYNYSQPTPYPLAIGHGVCSSVSPHHRSCCGRPKSFPSSDEHSHHQIDQIRTNGSRIGPRNSLAASQVLHSFLLFCNSSLSNDDILRKAFRDTPPTCSRRHNWIPQSNSSLRLRPYRIRRTLHVLLLRCSTGANEHSSRKTIHFACREWLGRLVAVLILC